MFVHMLAELPGFLEISTLCHTVIAWMQPNFIPLKNRCDIITLLSIVSYVFMRVFSCTLKHVLSNPRWIPKRDRKQQQHSKPFVINYRLYSRSPTAVNCAEYHLHWHCKPLEVLMNHICQKITCFVYQFITSERYIISICIREGRGWGFMSSIRLNTRFVIDVWCYYFVG